jgi:hypothetical protein
LEKIGKPDNNSDNNSGNKKTEKTTMRKLLTAGVILGVTAMQLAALPTTAVAQSSDVPLAILVPGGGTYSRPITTDSDLAQQFFDQGLRLA